MIKFPLLSKLIFLSLFCNLVYVCLSRACEISFGGNIITTINDAFKCVQLVSYIRVLILMFIRIQITHNMTEHLFTRSFLFSVINKLITIFLFRYKIFTRHFIEFKNNVKFCFKISLPSNCLRFL